MIESFGNQLTRDLFDDKNTRFVRTLPTELRRIARRKLLYLHDAAVLNDLKIPPGNRLEALKGDFRGHHSIRINNQWRLVFDWNHGNPANVQILDYHN